MNISETTEDLNYQPLSEDEYLYAILYAVIGADSSVTDEEERLLRNSFIEAGKLNSTETEIHDYLKELPEIHKRVVIAHKFLGSERLIEICAPILNRKTDEEKYGIMAMVAKLYYADDKFVHDEDDVETEKALSDSEKTIGIIYFHLINNLKFDVSEFKKLMDKEKEAATKRVVNIMRSKQMKTVPVKKTSTLKHTSPVKKEGCFIATAVYGSELSSEVERFYEMRDNYLNQHFFGRQFVKFYYKVSPAISKYISDKRILKS